VPGNERATPITRFSRPWLHARRLPAIAIVGLLIGLGCATSKPRELPLRLQWPEPPLTSRIEHVRTISSSLDLDPKQKDSVWTQALHFLLGTRKTVKRVAHPIDVEVSSDGRMLYVSDFAQGIVHVFDLEQGVARYLGDGRLARPFGLSVDSRGNLYIVEQAKRQIRVVSPTGDTVQIVQSDHLVRPADIVLDEQRDRFYVADASRQKSSEHFVRVFDLDGNYLGEVGKGRGFGNGNLLFPTYLTLGPDGSLYVSDTMNARISVFDPDGNFVRTIGERGDGFGQFDKPKGIAFDSFGNLYVVDSSWSNVQIFGPEDDILLYFGGRGGYPGLLRNPTAIAVSRNENVVYVGDYLNHRIVVYRLVNTESGDGLPSQNPNTGGTP
jgi:DNA-binding beta-propeller fold protein YncE